MSGFLVLEVLITVGAVLTLVGLIAVVAHLMRQNEPGKVLVTIEQVGHKKCVLTLPSDSPKLEELRKAATSSKAAELVGGLVVAPDVLETQAGSADARHTLWFRTAPRFLAALGAMLGSSVAATFIDNGWAIVIIVVAIIGVPLVVSVVVLGSDRRTQIFVASIYQFRHHELVKGPERSESASRS